MMRLPGPVEQIWYARRAVYVGRKVLKDPMIRSSEVTGHPRPVRQPNDIT
jgi:hypothetical protein